MRSQLKGNKLTGSVQGGQVRREPGSHRAPRAWRCSHPSSRQRGPTSPRRADACGSARPHSQLGARADRSAPSPGGAGGPLPCPQRSSPPLFAAGVAIVGLRSDSPNKLMVSHQSHHRLAPATARSPAQRPPSPEVTSVPTPGRRPWTFPARVTETSLASLRQALPEPPQCAPS